MKKHKAKAITEINESDPHENYRAWAKLTLKKAAFFFFLYTKPNNP